MPFCNVEHDDEPSHQLYYETYGNENAPNKIIFVMGLGGSMYDWEKQVQYFQARGNEFQILIFDNRGIGQSESCPTRWTTSKLARDASFLLNHLGWTHNIHVVGLSMGGMIAQELCKLNKNNRFASLTLLSTIAGGGYSLFYFILTIPSGIQLMIRANLPTTKGRERLNHLMKILYPEKFLQAVIGKHPKSGQDITNFNVLSKQYIKRALESKEKGVAIQPKLSTIIKQVGAVMTHHVTLSELDDISKSLNRNTLVVTGDDDILVHPKNSDRLRDGLSSKYILIPNSGHGVFDQESDIVNNAIADLILKAANSNLTTSKL